MGKIRGKNQHSLKAIGGLLMRCKSAVFRKTEHYLRVFSTGTEKERFSGFSGSVLETFSGNGARIGRILSWRTSRKEKMKIFI
jgi:hypothetical protein